MKSPVSDQDLMIHILNNMPNKYKSLVEAMESDLTTLKIEALWDCIQNKYCCLMKESEKQEDTALNAQGKNQYKLQCRICGKSGHKGDNCQSKKKKKNAGSSVTNNDDKNKKG